MRKIAKITAAILAVLLLSGCGADTIYIQTGTETTAAPVFTTAAATEAPTEKPTDGVTEMPAVEPTETTGEDLVWIPTKGGEKYHRTSTCSSMQEPQQVTKEDAEERGFTPCKRCYK